MNENEALARRWFQEVWNDRIDATVYELLPPHSVGHLEGGLDVRGAGEFMPVRASLFEAFPDLHVTVEETVAQADNVVVRWSAAGTHRGDSLGVPATGRAVSFRGLTWLRFEDGKLAEGWDAWNQGSLLQKLQAE
ncbi:MAG TPA: ester cyclase [Thermoanaerobaculia bacterium]|nr:ester cyclase [Thermoanaerobaculia bacterium]